AQRTKMARCPACGAENSEQSKRCATCGERTTRKPRRREPPVDTDTPFARGGEVPPSMAVRAYRYGVYSLIPLAGLVLGPVAIVLAVRAWRGARRDPEARSNGYARVALLLGIATLVCNAVGIALMVMALN